MILSMTGFGIGQCSTRQVDIEVNLRSLNGRYLDIRCHLPREYSVWEPNIKDLVSGQLQRGSVELYIHRRIKSNVKLVPLVNLGAAQGWLEACRQIAKATGLKNDLQLHLITQWPEVIKWQEPPIQGKEKSALIKATREALKNCLLQKKREGQALAQHLSQLFADLQTLVENIGQQSAKSQPMIQKKMEDRLSQSILVEKIDPLRMAQELAFYMDRSDISEETQRLGVHLGVCQQLLTATSSSGKRLDFYCQELLREVNTIGSKASLAGLTKLVVEAKAIIEKIKEQVQNIA